MPGLNTSKIKKLIEENKKGQFDNGTLLWRLLFQRWTDKHF
jgi:hypothetical protein